MEEIEEYENLHIAWVRQHPQFCGPTGRKGEEYIELIKDMYVGHRNIFEKYGYVSKLCKVFLTDDMKRQNKIDAVSTKLQALETYTLKGVECNDEMLWAFITIGFNEQTITPSIMATLSHKVAQLKYFKECYYVMEKHRENGIHHHTHFLVRFYKKEYKSSIIDWIYQTKGIKSHVLQKTFIDVLGPINPKKIYQPYEKYFDYVHGIKKVEKMPYVDLDRKWRDEIGISHIFKV